MLISIKSISISDLKYVDFMTDKWSTRSLLSNVGKNI